MKKMSLFFKLICANILYSIPVLALIYFMVSAQNVNIDFGLQEIKGNVYQRPAENILEKLVEARFSDTPNNQLSDAVNELKNLELAFNSVGADLQFTPDGLKKRNRSQIEFPAFSQRLKDFANSSPQMPLEKRSEILNGLIADVRTMIAHAGDTSNLILDPDLDSYYLMDITLLAFPQTQDRIAEILNYVKQLPTELNQEQKIKLSVYQALLKQSDVDRITADLQTTLNEDPNFYGESPTLVTKLKPSAEDFAKKGESFVAALGKVVENGKFTDKESLMQAGQDLLKTSFISWNVAVDELDVLLQNRVSILQAERTKSLVYSLFALAFAIFVLFWISSNFNSNMRRVLESLKNVVEETRSAGAQMVTLSEQLSSASTEQAAAIHQTSSAVVEIESMTRATLSNVSSSKDLSEESSEKTQEAFETMKNLTSAISEISHSNNSVMEQMELSRKEMAEITKIIAQIGTKTKVINEIVFQTKLLSFNASVEAARAGEYGKGFAVVAEEVGSLAQMSGSASKEISDMLDTSINSVKTMSENSNQRLQKVVTASKSKIDVGSQLAGECAESLDEIQKRVLTILETSQSIFQAASEQSKGIEEVSTAIVRIEKLAQQSMNMSKMTAEQSRVLSKQTNALNEISDVVQTVVMGKISVSDQDLQAESKDVLNFESKNSNDHEDRHAA